MLQSRDKKDSDDGDKIGETQVTESDKSHTKSADSEPGSDEPEGESYELLEQIYKANLTKWARQDSQRNKCLAHTVWRSKCFD